MACARTAIPCVMLGHDVRSIAREASAARPASFKFRCGKLGVPFEPCRLRASDGETGLRPESCWNDCLARRKSIRLCVPSHIAYEVGAARQQTVRSPRTMDPHSQEWHRNREATVYLPA